MIKKGLVSRPFFIFNRKLLISTQN